MISYSSFGSPVGQVFVAAGPRGVCSIAIGAERPHPEILHKLHPQHKPVRDDTALAPTVDTLLRYLNGEDVCLEAIAVDVSAGTPFQQTVWSELRRVPRGSVLSYNELAARVGRPLAARAVGNAMARNPVPLLVPCHRVIRADGSLGGFGCGVDVKKYLLRLEGIIPGETHAEVHHGR